MIKCPYCGAGPEKFDLRLKAYIPVDVEENGTVSLTHIMDYIEDVEQSVIDCISDDEDIDCRCNNCGKTFEVTDLSAADSVITLNGVRKKEESLWI